MFPGDTTTSFRDGFQARSPNRNHLLTKHFFFDLSQTRRYGRSHTNHSHFTLQPNSPTCTDPTPVGRRRLSHFQFNRHVLLMASLYLRENRHIVLLFVYFFLVPLTDSSKMLHQLKSFQFDFQPCELSSLCLLLKHCTEGQLGP